MPRSANFFVPLRVEGWGGRPPLDLDGWDQVTEFSLTVASGKLALASAGIEEVTVGHRARRLPRALERPQPQRGGDAGRATNPPDSYRLQIWPGPTEAPRAEIKHWPGVGRSRARRPARAAGRRGPRRARRDRRLERTGDALRLDVRLARRRRSHAGTATIRADGVVRWVVSSSRFHRAGAARRASRRCCPTPTTSAGSRSTAAPPTPSGSRTRCAPRTPSSPAATSPSRRS